MQRQETISEIHQRKYINNPKPNGMNNFTGLHHQSVHYNPATNYTGALLRYADSGMWVPHDIPVWISPLGILRDKAFYTIENGKPREVLRSHTYVSRYNKHLKKTGIFSDDVSSLMVGTIYNTTINDENSFVYTTGPDSNTAVPSDVTIYKIFNGSYFQKNNKKGKFFRYHVITEEGHINPVALRKSFLKRQQIVQFRKKEGYKKKVKRLRTEHQERKQEWENEKKRQKLDEVISSIRKKDKEDLTFDSAKNFIDSNQGHSVEDKSSLPIKEEVVELKEAATALLMLSIPKPTPSEDHFFNQRQQTLSLKLAKEKAIVKGKEIKQEQKQMIIRSSAYIEGKEKVKKLNEINLNKGNEKSTAMKYPSHANTLFGQNQTKEKLYLTPSHAKNIKKRITENSEYHKKEILNRKSAVK